MKITQIRLGKNMKHALNFACRHAGWHSYAKDRPTAEAIRRLERAGLVATNEFCQFRIS